MLFRSKAVMAAHADVVLNRGQRDMMDMAKLQALRAELEELDE